MNAFSWTGSLGVSTRSYISWVRDVFWATVDGALAVASHLLRANHGDVNERPPAATTVCDCYWEQLKGRWELGTLRALERAREGIKEWAGKSVISQGNLAGKSWREILRGNLAEKSCGEIFEWAKGESLIPAVRE
jgi:hypothetical protein